MLPLAEQPAESELTTAAERARLVRLCAQLTGDREAAEDLAQETLLAAWRNEHTLRDPQSRPQWLAGIARNMCLRWARRRGRELARLSQPAAGDDLYKADGVEGVADDFDVEGELERDELAHLLDRALALLPPGTREVLVARYIADSPYAEIAARLGVSEKAVSMRLARGKLLLRRILMTDLRQDAAPYGLGGPTDGAGWQETRIWCPSCGRRRLLGHFPDETGADAYRLRCPECHPEPGVYFANAPSDYVNGALLDGVKRFKPALSRLMVWADDFYRRGLRERVVTCPRCGSSIALRTFSPEAKPAHLRGGRGVHGRCAACGCLADQGLHGLLLMTPKGREFWRVHPRIQTLPTRGIEVDGCAALLTRLESMTDNAALEIICLRDTFEVLAIHGPLPPTTASSGPHD